MTEVLKNVFCSISRTPSGKCLKTRDKGTMGNLAKWVRLLRMQNSSTVVHGRAACEADAANCDILHRYLPLGGLGSSLGKNNPEGKSITELEVSCGRALTGTASNPIGFHKNDNALPRRRRCGSPAGSCG